MWCYGQCYAALVLENAMFGPLQNETPELIKVRISLMHHVT